MTRILRCLVVGLTACAGIQSADAQLTISDFNRSGFKYTFSRFSQSTGDSEVRLVDPVDSWGGAGLPLGLVDFSSCAAGRFSVDMTVHPTNGANHFELELIDINDNTGKWTFGIADATPEISANLVSRNALNNPDYGVGDWQNLDLTRIKTFQILGEFGGPGALDLSFDTVLISNNLNEPPAYPGHEPDAPWRAVADQRIERSGD